jgi:hypothetical protein
MENINDEKFSKFQVIIRFYMDETFMKLVPAHRVYINSLIDKNVVDYYAVSMETQRSWMIVNASNKKEVQHYLEQSSLYNYWTIEIEELFVYDSQAYRLPTLQLN